MKNLLAAIDFTDVTDDVINTAATLTKALQASLTLVHTDPSLLETELSMQGIIGVDSGIIGIGPDLAKTPILLDSEEDKIQAEISQHELNAIKEKLSQQGIPVQCVLLHGAPENAIREQAELSKADLIIIGSHRHSAFHHFLFGNISRSFITNAPCPVLVIPKADSKN